MSDTKRVQQWRQRQRDEGKEPMTLWLTHDTKLRLEDMARAWRSSPSELVEQALALFQPMHPHVTGTATDTELLRALIREELATSTQVTATITDTVAATLTDTVTATITDMVTATLPQVVRELMQDLRQEPATVTVADPVTDTAQVTDTATATIADTEGPSEAVPRTAEPRRGGRRMSALGERVLGLIAQHPEGLTAEALRVHLDVPTGTGGEDIPYSQKTQTHHFRSVYGLTVARSSPCNPPRYSPYSLPLRDHERLW
jgi:predicted transcriptional regulator